MASRREFLGELAAAATAVALPGPALLPAPRRVHTVRGPVDAERLGVTLPHEHVLAASAGLFQTWPELLGGRTAFRDRVVDRLKAVRDAGIDTIVDVTPVDVGRDVRLLEDVSHRSGLQIVAATGHWLSPSLTMAARTTEELAELFVLEIERGIDGTGIRPGVIKVATDRDGATPFLEKALRAAARASKATGVPVTTHRDAARGGEKQAELFEAEGLSPTRVCLGHCDETDDLEYLSGLAARGYTLGMDHLPMGLRAPAAALVPWRRRAECIKALIDRGYASRIFLSNDWYFGLSIAATGAMDTMDRLNPDGMLFVTRKVIPHLEQLGVVQEAIHAITVENPRRFLAGG